MMERVPVKSSNLRTVGYDPATEDLEITFRAGSVYRYKKVPKTVFEGLMRAQSLGKYLHAHIKNVYQWEKITGPTAEATGTTEAA